MDQIQIWVSGTALSSFLLLLWFSDNRHWRIWHLRHNDFKFKMPKSEGNKYILDQHNTNGQRQLLCCLLICLGRHSLIPTASRFKRKITLIWRGISQNFQMEDYKIGSQCCC